MRAVNLIEQPQTEAVPTTEKNPSIWRRVRRDFAVLGAGSLGIVLAQLAFRSILIVVLVPAEYGRLSLVLSVYNTAMLIGVSGLPDTAARYISLHGAHSDAAIVRAAVRAAAWPTVVASAVMAGVAGVILQSPVAAVAGAIGLAGMVFSLLSLGILRGRRRLLPAAAIMPAAAATEVLLLATAWKSGISISGDLAFGFFCFGNVVSVSLAAVFIYRTRPRGFGEGHGEVFRPSVRELLGFSLWLTTATVGIAAMPLIMRFAAAFDSYTVVGTVDVALVLLSLPQRVGSVIVSAVIPHASRDSAAGRIGVTISRREHLYLGLPFVAAAAVIAFTPLVEVAFDAIGRPAYAASADYLALALLASPARVLYGLVQGVLTGHGEGKFLAANAMAVTVTASCLIFAIAAAGSIVGAFAVFVAACWIVYLNALRRIHRIAQSRPAALATEVPVPAG
jgi:O-antigen/teichoic acid export membrane protein